MIDLQEDVAPTSQHTRSNKAYNVQLHHLQRPEVHNGHREVLFDLPRKLPLGSPRRDAMFVNETQSGQDYYQHLENQRRSKELQLEQLSAKINLGFKPPKTKKPF